MHMTMNLCSATSNCKAASEVTCSRSTRRRCGPWRRTSSAFRRLGVEVCIVRRPSVSGRLPRAERGWHHEDRHGVSAGATRGRP